MIFADFEFDDLFDQIFPHGGMIKGKVESVLKCYGGLANMIYLVEILIGVRIRRICDQSAVTG